LLDFVLKWKRQPLIDSGCIGWKTDDVDGDDVMASVQVPPFLLIPSAIYEKDSFADYLWRHGRILKQNLVT
jgi:hypothetical protein